MKFFSYGFLIFVTSISLTFANNLDDRTILDYIAQHSFKELINSTIVLGPQNSVDLISKNLWMKYIDTVKKDQRRKREHDQFKLTYGTRSMKFSKSVIGTRPKNGFPLYIALHGGGGAPTWLNDSQWNHMKIYYKSSVQTGVYIAPRGVSDTWNLHFMPESYPLYDRLIENMVAYEGVDPNRVYLLGFSAGGDGVYQIIPRMSDRWAAANMSAGHHNWINLVNLYNTPFLLQMGEMDSAYQRNKVAAQNYLQLQKLRQLHPNGYVNELFLHYGGSHNSWSDNDSSMKEYKIISSPLAWLEQNDRRYHLANTNAIQWLNNWQRNAHPQKIIWNLKTRAARGVSVNAQYAGHDISKLENLNYWLALDNESYADGNVIVEFSKDLNTINFQKLEAIDKIKVRLSPKMLDLNRPIKISIQSNYVGEIEVQNSLSMMTQTLLERGDHNFIFTSQALIKKNHEGFWSVSSI